MQVVTAQFDRNGNAWSMIDMYWQIFNNGYELRTRNTVCRNIRNFAIVMDANQSVLTSFKERKLNLAYCKEEWLWYLRANPFDSSIEKHATMWKKLRQPDGSYYSNYGQYMFNDAHVLGSQFEYVVNTLAKDPDSRRASMVLLQREHLFEDNSDVVCTYAINFTIQDDSAGDPVLHMTVMMRSNDVIYGFTNDSFCLHQLMKFVYAKLREVYPHLTLGTYTHFTNSMHVYDRHYEMISAIILNGLADYDPIDIPEVTSEEVDLLLRGVYLDRPYTAWLTSKS